jgi:hypothetical protein
MYGRIEGETWMLIKCENAGVSVLCRLGQNDILMENVLHKFFSVCVGLPVHPYTHTHTHTCAGISHGQN